jgi:hypothetical protein
LHSAVGVLRDERTELIWSDAPSLLLLLLLLLPAFIYFIPAF